MSKKEKALEHTTLLLMRSGYFERYEAEIMSGRIVEIVYKLGAESVKSPASERADSRMRAVYYDQELQERIGELQLEDCTTEQVAKALDYDIGGGAAFGYTSPEVQKLSYNMRWAGYERKQRRFGKELVRVWIRVEG